MGPAYACVPFPPLHSHTHTLTIPFTPRVFLVYPPPPSLRQVVPTLVVCSSMRHDFGFRRTLRRHNLTPPSFCYPPPKTACLWLWPRPKKRKKNKTKPKRLQKKYYLSFLYNQYFFTVPLFFIDGFVPHLPPSHPPLHTPTHSLPPLSLPPPLSKQRQYIYLYLTPKPHPTTHTLPSHYLFVLSFFLLPLSSSRIDHRHVASSEQHASLTTEQEGWVKHPLCHIKQHVILPPPPSLLSSLHNTHAPDPLPSLCCLLASFTVAVYTLWRSPCPTPPPYLTDAGGRCPARSSSDSLAHRCGVRLLRHRRRGSATGAALLRHRRTCPSSCVLVCRSGHRDARRRLRACCGRCCGEHHHPRG